MTAFYLSLLAMTLSVFSLCLCVKARSTARTFKDIIRLPVQKHRAGSSWIIVDKTGKRVLDVYMQSRVNDTERIADAVVYAINSTLIHSRWK